MAEEQLSRLRAIASFYEAGAVPEAPLRAMERTLAQVDFSVAGNSDALGRLIAHWDDVLPSLDFCRERMLAPAFVGMRTPPSAISAGLVVSIPAALDGRISLGWAERHWLGDGKLAAKIRISAFHDGEGKLAWEFGVAGRSPPPIRSLRAGVLAAARIAASYDAALDLTPSHKKAAWLSLRLGGRPADLRAYVGTLRAGGWEDIKGLRLLLPNLPKQG